MVFRSKFRKRRSFKRRSRNIRRPKRPMRTTRRLITGSLQIHRFKRQTVLFGQNGVANALISTTTGLGGGFNSIGFNFFLNQMPAYTEFTQLYDYYKINFVVLKIMWLGTNLSAIEVANTNTAPPVLYYTQDRDDVTPYSADTAGLQDIRQNGMCRRFVFTPDRRECTIKLKPNTLSVSYETTLTSAYTLQFNKWVDCADDATPYYGMKMLFHTPSPNSTPQYANTFEITATYYMSFKQPR